MGRFLCKSSMRSSQSSSAPCSPQSTWLIATCHSRSSTVAPSYRLHCRGLNLKSALPNIYFPGQSTLRPGRTEVSEISYAAFLQSWAPHMASASTNIYSENIGPHRGQGLSKLRNLFGRPILRSSSHDCAIVFTVSDERLCSSRPGDLKPPSLRVFATSVAAAICVFACPCRSRSSTVPADRTSMLRRVSLENLCPTNRSANSPVTSRRSFEPFDL